jgi:hypothetical protein
MSCYLHINQTCEIHTNMRATILESLTNATKRIHFHKTGVTYF